MMVTMNKKAFLIFFLMLFSLILTAQDKNGIWYEADASMKLIKKLKAELAGSIRTDENGSHLYSYWVQGGLRYKINDYFYAGAYYRLIERIEDNDDSNLYARHRFFIDLKGEIPVSRFTFSARYRFQRQTRIYIEEPEDEMPGYTNRLKLKLDYNIPSVPLKPFIAAEAFSQTFESNDIFVEKTRLSGGITYDISKKHAVSLEYIYQKSRVSKPAEFNIFALNYSIKL